jgi:hypothetical protein
MTAEGLGETASAMSLATVTVEVADLEGSARLEAVTLTAAGEGKSCGAVYTPVEEIVPNAGVPPATPFTLQETPMSIELVTLAENVCEFPKITEALGGVTVTAIPGGGGGGGGGTNAVAPPPHPCNEMTNASGNRNKKGETRFDSMGMEQGGAADFLRERSGMLM